MKELLIDKKQKLIVRSKDERVMEVIFYDSLINNIYRARVENKIDSLNAYFVKINDDENLFLKSTLDYKVGDNAIIQYVRKPANGKLGLASENFRLENNSYELMRYPLSSRPKLKKSRPKDKNLYKSLIKEKETLINEEKFYPSPKLLKENSLKDDYIIKYKDYELKTFDARNSKLFRDLIKFVATSELSYKDMSIIIDELETLTVIDVNTGSRKSKMKKDDFLMAVNLDLLDFIAYNLRLRNIGGMVVVDFLRVRKKEKLKEEFEKSLKKYGLEAKSYGFSQMGLFELVIKRRGESLRKELCKRKLLS